MRIEYKVLWVEDDKSWYGTTLELFEGVLEDLGFVLKSKKCENIDEVKAEIQLNKLKDYDLLLVDYTLKNSDSGDKIIDFIRSIKDEPILTDVLFYSSAVDMVRDSMHQLGLEGVYTCDKKEIENKFELVLNTTIKKIQEVNPMRGLIMAETSDLDELMMSIVSIVRELGLIETYDDYIETEMKNTFQTLSSLINSEEIHLGEKIKDTRIYTSFHKAKSINKLYKETKIGIDKFFDSYNKDVISTRNNFAHVKESIENGEKVLISHSTNKKEIFNDKRCIEIRKALIDYRKVLEKIHKEVIDIQSKKSV